jgi:hypothetical protein
MGRVVAVVDEVARVRRGEHVEVEEALDLRPFGGRQVVDVELRPAQPQLLRAEPGEAQMLGGRETGRGDRLGDLQQRGRAGAVVVDAGSRGDAVEVRASHQNLVGVAARPVGDYVPAGGAARGERLDGGDPAGRVQLGLDVVAGGLESGPAVRAVAAVRRRDALQLRQVGLDVRQRDVGHGQDGCRRLCGRSQRLGGRNRDDQRRDRERGHRASGEK